MDTPQELCLTCGLCCDGTLFGGVNLKAGDRVAPLLAAGIEIRTKGTGQSFEQPCPAHRQGCCQVYADRPATCRKYRCELLKKFETGRVSWTEAQQKIGRAKGLRDTIATELARLAPESGRMSVRAVLKTVPLRSELEADSALRATWAPLMLHLSVLIDCLQTSFQRSRTDNGSSADMP